MLANRLFRGLSVVLTGRPREYLPHIYATTVDNTRWWYRRETRLGIGAGRSYWLLLRGVRISARRVRRSVNCTRSRRSPSLPTTTTTGMDAGAKKLLETATIETLHANNFSRASTQATQVLTDLLSRYLSLVASTCAKYAEHAGRLRLSARDAVSALGELGLDVQELSEYATTEGRELTRYARHSTRRVEDLNEFKGKSCPSSCVLLSYDALCHSCARCRYARRHRRCATACVCALDDSSAFGRRIWWQ